MESAAKIKEILQAAELEKLPDFIAAYQEDPRNGVQKLVASAQKKLDAEERKKNLRNAFQAAGPVTGLRILVVDDVYTTGSTVEAMAECLLENGAKAVFFVTLCTGNI